MNHEEVRQTFKWGTLGKDGKGPLKYIILKDISNEHLNNILRFIEPLEHYYSVDTLNIIRMEILYRRINDIFVPEYPKDILLFKFLKK